MHFFYRQFASYGQYCEIAAKLRERKMHVTLMLTPEQRTGSIWITRWIMQADRVMVVDEKLNVLETVKDRFA